MVGDVQRLAAQLGYGGRLEQRTASRRTDHQYQRHGIAVSADGTATVAALMEASDQALYAAKNAGRNGYAVRAVGAAATL